MVIVGNGQEGVRNKNCIVTNCLGPVFVKNPWWTESILKNAVLNKYTNMQKQEEYKIENASFEATKLFIVEKPKVKKEKIRGDKRNSGRNYLSK